jgi:hypothetical protein
MAIPSNPSVTTIVTQALKRAGRTVPIPTQITEASQEALQEVKADIMLVAATHPNLINTATTVTTRGLQRYTVPEDYNIQQSIVLLDGPDEWRGTAQGGSTNTITLAASLSVSADDIIGKYILLTGGPGVEEYREIIEYNSSTKVATVDLNWLSAPETNTTYLIVTAYYQLWPLDTATELDRIMSSTYLGIPRSAALSGQEFLLCPVPDKSTYGLQNRYYVDLSKLDETGDLFVQLLREWRSVFIQGVAVKTMQRFDEDRYQLELSVYDRMLTALASQTCQVTQMRQTL